MALREFVQVRFVGVASAIWLVLFCTSAAFGQQNSSSPTTSSPTNGQTPAPEAVLSQKPDATDPSGSAATADPLTPESPSGELPESPGAMRTKDKDNDSVEHQETAPPTPADQAAPQEPEALPEQRQAAPPSPRVTTQHEPLGTAAAESIPITGVAAFRPTGAALAPAKQRRVRSLLIKVGAVVGVGVAVGTTMALSQSSPSRPPGAH